MNIIAGIKNFIRWRKVIWNDRDWDYEFLLVLMEKKLEFIREELENGGYVGCKKDAIHVHRASLVVKRIINNDYLMSPEADRLRLINKEAFKHYINYMDAQDMDYLALILKKHLRRWWT